MSVRFPGPTWLVGCGNMAGAMVDGWRSAGLDFSETVVIRPSGKPVEGIRTVTSLAEAGSGAPPRLMLLGFKPQKLDDLTDQLAPWISSKTIILSILAGASAASLKARFPRATVVRAMPNLPVSVRRGVTALYSADADDSLRREISELFSALGFGLWTENEDMFGAIGAVAGSGPAYVARFVAALAKAGAERGLPAETASTIALETVLGTGWLAAASGEGMDSLASRVASPGGTTERGLSVLDSGQALDRLVVETVKAATRRGAEMAQELASPKLAAEPPLP